MPPKTTLAPLTSGMVFGRFTILQRVEDLKTTGHRKQPVEQYLCLCQCGNKHKVRGESLRYGLVLSCGCSRRRKHPERDIPGMCGTPEYALWCQARRQANKRRLEFSITPHDIHIPDVCLLLGIPLVRTSSTRFDNPSLDRKDSNRGYTPDNIWVISYRANAIKNNATLNEMEMLVKNWREKI